MKEIIYYGSYLVFPFIFFLILCKKSHKIGRIFFILLSLLFIYSRFIETQLITINTTQINIGFESNIVLISDLHLGKYKSEKYLNRVVNKINNIPDIDYVFIAGDLTGNPEKKEIDKLFKPLGDLIYPTYWVLGNHDVEKPGPNIRKELIQSLNSSGLHYLNNESVDLNNFTLIGFGSNWNKEDDTSLLNDYGKKDKIIVLTHNPDTTSKYINSNADLTLAGHTHAGQVRIPIIYKDVIPTQGDFDKGLTQEKYTQLFISAGLGETGIPMRLFNPPVIDILKLK